jgi:antitoxin component YwqK of YwqJK toxin-antitoxin module
MKKIHLLSSLFISGFLCLSAVENRPSKIPSRTELLPRQPEWKPSILERHSSGQPSVVVFLEEKEDGQYQPIKKILFYENGKTKEECDLISMNSGLQGCELLELDATPHGISAEFYETGHLKKLAFYNRGLLDGNLSTYYPDGKPRSSLDYKNGQREGKSICFHENQVKSEEGFYKNDQLEGTYCTYYENGNLKTELDRKSVV